MKFKYMLGILCGVLLAVGALTWWSFMPASPDLHPGAPSAGRAGLSESNFIPENQSQPMEPQLLAGDTAPGPAAELPGVDMPERRCLQLAERDPRAALILAIESRLYETSPGLLQNLAAQWAAQDFQAAHEWVLQQEPGEWRDGLMARAAFAGSQSDPVAAAQIVVTEMAPGPGQNEAAISVLHQWAQIDLEAAASWAATFPPGDLRARAQAEIEGIRQYTSNRAQP